VGLKGREVKNAKAEKPLILNPVSKTHFYQFARKPVAGVPVAYPNE
jgi:hypothetical protein